jgi:hypothetical protein
VRARPALVACVLTAGASLAATGGLVAIMARSADDSRPPGVDRRRTVEVRIGEDVNEDEARSALREWLADQPDVRREGGLTVVDAAPDTVSEPS